MQLIDSEYYKYSCKELPYAINMHGCSNFINYRSLHKALANVVVLCDKVICLCLLMLSAVFM